MLHHVLSDAIYPTQNSKPSCMLPAGLSETFVMLDDDFLLTAPWTLADFVGADGAQVLTGACTH